MRLGRGRRSTISDIIIHKEELFIKKILEMRQNAQTMSKQDAMKLIRSDNRGAGG